MSGDHGHAPESLSSFGHAASGSSIDHHAMMHAALDEARKSPPKPTNFCVGALLVDGDSGEVLARGYTLELEGNTHAEQCCLVKFARSRGVVENEVGVALPIRTLLYTTMEPCNFRLSGNLPCVERIVGAKNSDGQCMIRTVYIGVKEPEKFVGENRGRKKLEKHGIACVHVPGLEDEILKVATAGHDR